MFRPARLCFPPFLVGPRAADQCPGSASPPFSQRRGKLPVLQVQLRVGAGLWGMQPGHRACATWRVRFSCVRLGAMSGTQTSTRCRLVPPIVRLVPGSPTEGRTCVLRQFNSRGSLHDEQAPPRGDCRGVVLTLFSSFGSVQGRVGQTLYSATSLAHWMDCPVALWVPFRTPMGNTGVLAIRRREFRNESDMKYHFGGSSCSNDGF